MSSTLDDTALTFTPADVPPSPDDSTDATPGTDVCNYPGCDRSVADYAGKGRRPVKCEEHRGQRGASVGSRPVRSAGKQTDAALAQMETLYNLITMGLLILNPVLAQEFGSGIERAQTINRNAFDADPKLAKRIASGGSNFGPLIFVAAQATIVGPTMRLAYDIARERSRTAKEERGDQPFAAFTPPTADTFVPDPHAHVDQSAQNGDHAA